MIKLAIKQDVDTWNLAYQILEDISILIIVLYIAACSIDNLETVALVAMIVRIRIPDIRIIIKNQ